MNARTRRSAVGALADDAGISRASAAQLLSAFEKRHQPISEAFGSDAGVRLMRIDSELILGALRASNDDGFGALPVHDSLIAPARFINLAAEKMVEAFETLVGRKPLSGQDKRDKGSTYGRRKSTSPDVPLVVQLSTNLTEKSRFARSRRKSRRSASRVTLPAHQAVSR